MDPAWTAGNRPRNQLDTKDHPLPGTLLAFNVATRHCHAGGEWPALPDDENRPVREMDDLVRGTPEDEAGKVTPSP